MDTGILHTHHLLGVILLVLVGMPVVFPNLRQKLGRWHMVLDTLLLLTGIYLVVRAPAAFSGVAIGKYLLVLGAIGLAIVGGRKNRKSWQVLAFLMLAYGYGLALQRDFLLRGEASRVKDIGQGTPSVAAGAALYQELCQRCHGGDGRAGYRKSPSLRPANGDPTYWAAVIKNGKGMMPAHPYLSDAQVASLVLFLQSWQTPAAPTP
jgi:mono/diheme cytochrome c family protein